MPYTVKTAYTEDKIFVCTLRMLNRQPQIYLQYNGYYTFGIYFTGVHTTKHLVVTGTSKADKKILTYVSLEMPQHVCLVL